MKKNKFEIALALISIIIPLVIIISTFSYISTAIEDSKKEIGAQGGLSSIFAKGIDAVEEFKEDIQKKRKK